VPHGARLARRRLYVVLVAQSGSATATPEECERTPPTGSCDRVVHCATLVCDVLRAAPALSDARPSRAACTRVASEPHTARALHSFSARTPCVNEGIHTVPATPASDAQMLRVACSRAREMNEVSEVLCAPARAAHEIVPAAPNKSKHNEALRHCGARDVRTVVARAIGAHGLSSPPNCSLAVPQAPPLKAGSAVREGLRHGEATDGRKSVSATRSLCGSSAHSRYPCRVLDSDRNGFEGDRMRGERGRRGSRRTQGEQ